MKYLITGQFNKNLDIFCQGEKLFHSIVFNEISFSNREVKIFDSYSNSLILSYFENESIIREKINFDEIRKIDKKEILFKKREGFSYRGLLEIVDNKEKILFKYSLIPFLNPYIKIYMFGNKIGEVRKDFFKLKKQFSVKLDPKINNSYQYYILIYILLFETIFDHE